VLCYGQTDTVVKFTGQVRDGEAGMDYFVAGYMAGPQGRFLSPDPDNAGANPAFPQSWNGYGYTTNNPLVNTDPDGLFCPANGCDDSDLADAEAAAQATWDLWRLTLISIGTRPFSG
jgi:RHS repeat-associated protein